MTKKKEAPKINPNTEIVQNAVYKPKTMQLDTFINYKTMLQEPLTTTNLERLCRDLTAWAMGDENALKIAQFLEGRGINQRTWTRWVSKYEILAEANDFADIQRAAAAKGDDGIALARLISGSRGFHVFDGGIGMDAGKNCPTLARNGFE